MESDARYTIVGAALLALIAALAVTVVWLKQSGAERDYTYYTILFEHQALHGLQVGGDVTVRGLKVGRVQDYRLSEQRINRVRVTVRVLRQVPVRTNTVAIITRNIVTGIAQIVLLTPEPPGEPLGAPPAGEPYPLIAEGRSDLDEFTGRVAQLGEQAAEAMANINRLLSAENRDAFAKTLGNVRDMTANINRRLESLDKALLQFGAAATEVARAGDRIATTVEGAGGKLDTTFAEAQKALAEAQRAAAEVTRAAGTLQAEARRITRRVDDSAQALDEQMLVAVSELRVTLEAATRTLDRLQDPRGALLGPGSAQLGPGEKLQ